MLFVLLSICFISDNITATITITQKESCNVSKVTNVMAAYQAVYTLSVCMLESLCVHTSTGRAQPEP